MNGPCIMCHYAAPARRAQTQREVEILLVEKDPLIKTADLRERCTSVGAGGARWTEQRRMSCRGRALGLALKTREASKRWVGSQPGAVDH